MNDTTNTVTVENANPIPLVSEHIPPCFTQTEERIVCSNTLEITPAEAGEAAAREEATAAQEEFDHTHDPENDRPDMSDIEQMRIEAAQAEQNSMMQQMAALLFGILKPQLRKYVIDTVQEATEDMLSSEGFKEAVEERILNAFDSGSFENAVEQVLHNNNLTEVDYESPEFSQAVENCIGNITETVLDSNDFNEAVENVVSEMSFEISVGNGYRRGRR